MPWPRRKPRFSSLQTAILVVATGVLAAGPVRAAPETSGDPSTAVETAGTGPLEARIVAEKLEVSTGPDGREVKRFVEARRLAAGEEVHYTIRVRNPGKEPVGDVVVSKRMPQGVDYVRGSATGPACDVEFSSDEGATYGPEKKTVEYTHLRWTCRKPLAPGATALLRFRAIFR
jgi:uncharacterized repeat protein (TIGR01451 family)